MKVFFLVNHLGFGGAERTVTYLSSYLADQGDKVVIYSMTDRIDYQISGKVRVLFGGMDKHHRKTIGRLYDIICRMVKINRAIKRESPDVVFCMIASIAKYLISNRKYCLIVSERANPKQAPKGEYELEKRVFQKADGIIFQTKRVRENYKGLIEGKHTVIPNAVGNEQAYEVSWNPAEDKIVAIGRLDPQKDYPTMIDAFEIFHHSHPAYVLEIYGDGPEKEKLEEYVKRKKMTQSVIFRGTCPDVIKRASTGKNYLLTSVSEGMPNSLMEAMAVGMPCVAADCEYGPAELIHDGVNGLLVPVREPGAIAAAISKMIDDEEFAKKCGRAAKKILETQNVDIICKKYRDYFYEAAGKGHPRCNIMNLT